jgi:hypothetical protein
MAYPSIAVTSGELLFASAGGYAIFNFYKTRDGSHSPARQDMAHATRNLTVTLDKSANPPVTVVEGNLSVGKHDYRIIWKPADSPYQDPP